MTYRVNQSLRWSKHQTKMTVEFRENFNGNKWQGTLQSGALALHVEQKQSNYKET